MTALRNAQTGINTLTIPFLSSFSFHISSGPSNLRTFYSTPYSGASAVGYFASSFHSYLSIPHLPVKTKSIRKHNVSLGCCVCVARHSRPHRPPPLGSARHATPSQLLGTTPRGSPSQPRQHCMGPRLPLPLTNRLLSQRDTCLFSGHKYAQIISRRD